MAFVHFTTKFEYNLKKFSFLSHGNLITGLPYTWPISLWVRSPWTLYTLYLNCFVVLIYISVSPLWRVAGPFRRNVPEIWYWGDLTSTPLLYRSFCAALVVWDRTKLPMQKYFLKLIYYDYNSSLRVKYYNHPFKTL